MPVLNELVLRPMLDILESLTGKLQLPSDLIFCLAEQIEAPEDISIAITEAIQYQPGDTPRLSLHGLSLRARITGTQGRDQFNILFSTAGHSFHDLVGYVSFHYRVDEADASFRLARRSPSDRHDHGQDAIVNTVLQVRLAKLPFDKESKTSVENIVKVFYRSIVVVADTFRENCPVTNP
jgi:hypothetical protein